MNGKPRSTTTKHRSAAVAVDVNCGLGGSAGKRDGARDVGALLARMDRLAIDRALVYATSARKGHWQQGNAWLMRQLGEQRTRLIPCWVVAPEPTLEIRWADWTAGLKQAGVGAVRLCPRSQHHLLAPEVCGPLLECLARARVPVIIDFEIFGWNESPDWTGLAALAAAFPRLPLIVPGCVLGASRNLYAHFKKRYPNLYLDIGAFQEMGGLIAFVRTFGAHRAVWGTYFPDRGPEMALGLLHGRQLGSQSRRAIAGENLCALMAGRTPAHVPPEVTAPNTKMPVPAIDVHVHLGGYAFGGPVLTAAAAVEALDAWGAHCGIVSGLELLGGHVEEANRGVLEACQQFPGRLYGWAFYDAAQPKLSAKVCRDMLRHACFVGFKVHESVDDRRLDDSGYHAMFAMAEELSLPILTHENVHEGFSKTLSLLARKWPHVAILHAHHGGCQDATGAERLAALLKKHRNLWYETSCSFAPPDAVGCLVRESGAKRLCFGTDMGFMDPDGQIGKILFADLAHSQRADVLRYNALRLLPRLAR